MDVEKFIRIVENNKGLEEALLTYIEDFKQHQWDGLAPVLYATKCLEESVELFVLPLKSKQIGGLHCRIKGNDFVILNSNLPRCKIIFTSFHDLYHYKYQLSSTRFTDEEFCTVEELADAYSTDQAEIEANFFAANIIMEPLKFKKAYAALNIYYPNNLDAIVSNLIINFSAPLEAVLLRLFELELLSNFSVVEKYLNMDDNEVIELLVENNCDKVLMEPLGISNLSKLNKYIEKILEFELMSEYDIFHKKDRLMKLIKRVTVGG